MAPISDFSTVKKEFLPAGEVVSLIVSLIALVTIAVFFCRRLHDHDIHKLPTALWILLPAYAIHFAYIFILTVAIHMRFRTSALCDASIMTCLTLYCLTKAIVFLFLIERAYTMTWSALPRWKHPEYVASCICIFCPYIVASALCIDTRVFFYNQYGVCTIGMKLWALIFLSAVEVSSYLYLTLRFLIPILSAYFNSQKLTPSLKKAVWKTCIGALIALVSTASTKVLLALFHGAPAWLCCLACKCDAFVAVCVLHWITQPQMRTLRAADVVEQREPTFVTGVLALQDSMDGATLEESKGRSEERERVKRMEEGRMAI